MLSRAPLERDAWIIKLSFGTIESNRSSFPRSCLVLGTRLISLLGLLPAHQAPEPKLLLFTARLVRTSGIIIAYTIAQLLHFRHRQCAPLVLFAEGLTDRGEASTADQPLLSTSRHQRTGARCSLFITLRRRVPPAWRCGSSVSTTRQSLVFSSPQLNQPLPTEATLALRRLGSCVLEKVLSPATFSKLPPIAAVAARDWSLLQNPISSPQSVHAALHDHRPCCCSRLTSSHLDTLRSLIAHPLSVPQCLLLFPRRTASEVLLVPAEEACRPRTHRPVQLFTTTVSVRPLGTLVKYDICRGRLEAASSGFIRPRLLCYLFWPTATSSFLTSSASPPLPQSTAPPTTTPTATPAATPPSPPLPSSASDH